LVAEVVDTIPSIFETIEEEFIGIDMANVM
jgi:hypothetical protein